MTDLPRDLALQAISFYQRYISPYKGYRCAYAVHTGCASCSRLGFRAIRWRGLLDGLRLLVQRFSRCRDVFERYRQRTSATKATRLASAIGQDQRGYVDCDCGCLPCDNIPLNGAARMFDSQCCSPCDFLDWPSSKQRQEDRARQAAEDARRRRELRARRGSD